MNKPLKAVLLSSLAAAALLLAAFPGGAHEHEKHLMGVSAGHSTLDVLKAAKAREQRVQIILKNGLRYSAFVKDAAAHAVVLKGPAGKEFYEIYVVLGEIAAIEVRVRES